MEVPDLFEDMLRRLVSEDKDSKLKALARKLLKRMDGVDVVCKLKKAIYGLRQAGRCWYSEVSSALKELDLTPTNADPCVYTDGSDLTFVLVYVDDFLIFTNDLSKEKRIKDALSRKFKVKDLGEARFCLGIEIIQTRESITLSQTGYFKDIMRKFCMEDCKPVCTPLAAGAKLTNYGDVEGETFPYRELVGSLMYAALATRPDIAHAVSVLRQFNDNPKRLHWAAAKRVLRYLQGTSDLGLKFTRDDKSLTGYADADWGNCTMDRRSYTGSVFILSRAAISWESRKQRTVALSSTESEYMAISDAAKEAVYLINFLKELKHPEFAKTTLFNDNQEAGKLAENLIFHSRSKHIDVRHHFVRLALKDFSIGLNYLAPEEMVADRLTKGLATPKHKKCVLGFGLSSKGKINRST